MSGRKVCINSLEDLINRVAVGHWGCGVFVGRTAFEVKRNLNESSNVLALVRER